MKIILLFFLLVWFGNLDAQTKEEYNERAVNHMYAKEYEQAILNFTKVIELNPNDSLAYFDRGMAREYAKDFQGAIEDYTLQLKVDPNMVDCYFLRGILERRLNNIKKAEADFLKTIELEEDNADAHYFLAKIYFAKKKNNRALQHMNQAIIFNPEVGDYYDLRSKIEEKLKMKSEAEEDVLKRNELYKEQK